MPIHKMRFQSSIHRGVLRPDPHPHSGHGTCAHAHTYKYSACAFPMIPAAIQHLTIVWLKTLPTEGICATSTATNQSWLLTTSEHAILFADSLIMLCRASPKTKHPTLQTATRGNPPCHRNSSACAQAAQAGRTR